MKKILLLFLISFYSHSVISMDNMEQPNADSQVQQVNNQHEAAPQARAIPNRYASDGCSMIGCIGCFCGVALMFGFLHDAGII